MQMKKTEFKPLGHVELPSGPYAVYPMNDIFMNYTFESEEYWETLRQIVNIVTNDFKAKFPHSVLRPITGKIKVRTQYRQFVTCDPKTALSQDIQILEDGQIAALRWLIGIHLSFEANMLTAPFNLAAHSSVRNMGWFASLLDRFRGRIL